MTTQTKQMSLHRLTIEIRKLVDILRDPIIYLRKPLEYNRAQRELFYLLSDKRHWDSILDIHQGHKSNHAIHNLGKARIEWLKEFYANEVERAS